VNKLHKQTSGLNKDKEVLKAEREELRRQAGWLLGRSTRTSNGYQFPLLSGSCYIRADSFPSYAYVFTHADELALAPEALSPNPKPAQLASFPSI